MLLVAFMNTLYSTERNRKTCECYMGIWNVVDVPSSRYYAHIRLKRMGKTTKIFNEDSQ